MPDDLRCLGRSLQCVLLRTLSPLHELAAQIPACCRSSDGRQTHTVLRIDCGNPHALGCSDIKGHVRRLGPLLNQRTGVVAAFRELGLNVARLPAACISSQVASAVGSG